MEGCSSQNSGPELASSIPPPSTPLCQPHKVLQGREIAPIHVLQTAPPAPKSLPNPTCIPCIPPVGAKPGGGSLPALPSRLLAVPEPLWQPCRARREGGKQPEAARAQSKRHRRASTGSRRQTDRHGEEGDAPPVLYLSEG